MVEIKDKSVKIGIQGNFGMLILKQLGYTLNFAARRAVICNSNWPTHFYETNDMFIIVKIIYDIGKSFQIKDGCQISRF